MSVESTGAVRPSFDLKSAQLPVLSVVLRGTDMQALVQDLKQRLSDDPDFFDNDPVLIDLSQVNDAVDSAVLKPVATVYRDATPDLIRTVRGVGYTMRAS